MSGIEHLISNAIYGDMVERGKPEPDIAVVSKEAKEGITAELADLHEVAAWIRKENKK